MSVSTRQRRAVATSESGRGEEGGEWYTKNDKPSSSGGNTRGEEGLRWLLPLFLLGTLRYMSATSNIIHDCDEVFNYWEPLHFLLYKSGFQTWEYRSALLLPPSSGSINFLLNLAFFCKPPRTHHNFSFLFVHASMIKFDLSYLLHFMLPSFFLLKLYISLLFRNCVIRSKVVACFMIHHS